MTMDRTARRTATRRTAVDVANGVRAARRSSAPLALLLAGIACSGAAPDRDDASPKGEQGTLEQISSTSDSLRVWLETPDEVHAGDPVPLTLRVQNVSDRTVDLYLTGRPVAFDLFVTDGSGEVVWRRLEDTVIPAILQIRTLGPGEGLEFEDSWDQRTNSGELVPPGEYAVRGEVLAEDEPLSAPRETLHITAP